MCRIGGLNVTHITWNCPVVPTVTFGYFIESYHMPIPLCKNTNICQITIYHNISLCTPPSAGKETEGSQGQAPGQHQDFCPALTR